VPVRCQLLRPDPCVKKGFAALDIDLHHFKAHGTRLGRVGAFVLGNGEVIVLHPCLLSLEPLTGGIRSFKYRFL
jgi:hypothetical protein